MDGLENIEAGQTNGATPPPSVAAEEKKAAEKPWITAGFKTRDEWRKAKGQRTGKSAEREIRSQTKKAAAAPKPAKKTKPAKKQAAKPVKKVAKKPAKKMKAKSVKKTKPAKKAAAPKHKYPQTAAERRKAHERTLKFMKSTGKREEPNKDEATILHSVKVGGSTTIDKMAAKFSGTLAKRKSRVRNALRWCVASKRFKKIDRGEYKRLK